MTDLTERLRELTDDHAILLPIAYIDGPDYAELTGASGEKVALTVYPALLTAVNAIPDLLTTLETLTQENARLRDGLKRIARYGRDMSGESCAETASVALHSGPAVADVLAKSRSLDPTAWAQADAGRHTRDNNIRIERANDAARKALGGGDEG